uniref:Uncharacterized protein n=1 Tax=Arundo donax TaxID=35708 RepID=A0A0A9CGG3_ARUDO
MTPLTRIFNYLDVCKFRPPLECRNVTGIILEFHRKQFDFTGKTRNSVENSLNLKEALMAVCISS